MEQYLNKITNDDIFNVMPNIPDKSIDMILTDMPYNMTACHWDKEVIPLDKLWEGFKRIIKDNGAIVMTASQPFTSKLVMSNLKMFKYEWVWEKSHPTGFASAKKKPLKYHENILVFYSNPPTYNPQFWDGEVNHSMGVIINGGKIKSESYVKIKATQSQQSTKKYPKSVQKFNNPRIKNMHPTQKPVALFEYLIKTYTNEGDIVFDGFAGSGTTGVACKKLNRNFICVELDESYARMAQQRIDSVQPNLLTNV